MFELRLRTTLAQMAADTALRSVPARLMALLRDEIAAMLLADNLPPSPRHVAMLVDDFAHLADLSRQARPFLRRQGHTLALHFDLSALQSKMLLEAPDDLILGYTQTMMGFLLFQPAPRNIGMIGLGGGSLAKFCYRYLPHAAIAVAEIDDQVIALRDVFHIPRDDERLQVRRVDGADFVRQAADRFDVLLVDGFDKNGQPPQLCSQRFYDDCYRALAPGGILVVNLLADAAEIRQYLDRLHTAFDAAVIVIDALDCVNKIAFACRHDILAVDDTTLTRRLDALRDDIPVGLDWTARSLFPD